MPKKFCGAYPCRNLIPDKERFCPEHQPKNIPANEKRADPFYTSGRWQKVRNAYIRRHPLCEHCLARGEMVAGTEVDHIVEIKDGGSKLDFSNLQTLCRSCHAIKTAQEQRKRKPRRRKAVVYSY